MLNIWARSSMSETTCKSKCSLQSSSMTHDAGTDIGRRRSRQGRLRRSAFGVARAARVYREALGEITTSDGGKYVPVFCTLPAGCSKTTTHQGCEG